MSKLNYSVSAGILELPDGLCIEVGFASWWHWLESDEARSFRFECNHGVKNYTARKEAIKLGQFWYGYKKVKGRLHKSYIGKSDELTQERLEVVAYDLLTPGQPRQQLPKVLGNSREEMERLKAEVAQLKEVLKERDRKDELEKTQQALCISQPSCLELIDGFLEFEGADRQGVTARQKVNEALISSQKHPRFSMLAKFRVWLESR